jgi:hypothetical protein
MPAIGLAVPVEVLAADAHFALDGLLSVGAPPCPPVRVAARARHSNLD